MLNSNYKVMLNYKLMLNSKTKLNYKSSDQVFDYMNL